MNGKKVLVDSNIIIYLSKGKLDVDDFKNIDEKVKIIKPELKTQKISNS